MKQRLLITLALVGLLSAIPLSRAGAEPAIETERAVNTIPTPTQPSEKVGSSTLTRTDRGLSFSLQTTGLEPGHTVTIWWMVANPDGGVAVLYAAGHVIDESGTAEFGGHLKVGDSDGYVMGTDTSLEDAYGAEVTLVVRDHGLAEPGRIVEQIHTFDDFCNPTCTDLQTSVHEAP